VPHSLEANGRVQESQAETSDDDHEAFHDHEHCLVIDKKRAVETARELDASVDASRQDGDGGDDESDEEAFEEACLDKTHVPWVPCSSMRPDSVRELAPQDAEQKQGEDLEGQTRQHDVLAKI